MLNVREGQALALREPLCLAGFTRDGPLRYGSLLRGTDSRDAVWNGSLAK